jgi:hypothetical protein
MLGNSRARRGTIPAQATLAEPFRSVPVVSFQPMGVYRHRHSRGGMAHSGGDQGQGFSLLEQQRCV